MGMNVIYLEINSYDTTAPDLGVALGVGSQCKTILSKVL